MRQVVALQQRMAAMRKAGLAGTRRRDDLRCEQPSRHHIHVFWSDEDHCWIADVQDLRFCSAHGQTPAEAVAELEVAVAGRLQTAHERGLPIPEPRGR